MQIELSFIFPHALREVPVGFLIPFPEQRPRTVANLAFMCTGQLPLPAELLAAMRLSAAEVAYATPEEARSAGLVPLSDSAVVRIDKAAAIEIGSSTTKSIFGGFVADEAVTLPASTVERGQSIAATMSLLKAGTLLYGNLGIPNTQASRYYILLESLTTADQRAEFAGFAALGMVTTGLAELKRVAAQAAVQPRTLVPKKKVVVSGCKMQLDYAQLQKAALHSPATDAVTRDVHNAHDSGCARSQHLTEPHERLAGRVRQRDDDEEKQPRNACASDALRPGENAASNVGSTAGGPSGFFNLSARFPKAVSTAVAVSGAGPLLKRRRAESLVLGSDGLPTLRTTAIAPGEGGTHEGGNVPFEFFRSQQAAFLNDIEGIKDVQRQRWKRRVKDEAKKRQALTASKKRASAVAHVHALGSSATAKGKATKKTISRRY